MINLKNLKGMERIVENRLRFLDEGKINLSYKGMTSKDVNEIKQYLTEIGYNVRTGVEGKLGKRANYSNYKFYFLITKR